MTWQAILSLIAAFVLAALLLRRALRERLRRKQEPHLFFAPVLPVLEEAVVSPAQTPGSLRLTGRYQGLPVQVTALTDTMALRRLPALWLLVTIPAPLPLAAKFDMMMRPAGQTTFSNFDLLRDTIGCPPGFPEEAIVRSDNAEAALPAEVVAPHLDFFASRRAKELLIAPEGLRIVWLLAEGDRARYGVFRQADFGDVTLDPDLLRDLLDWLCKLHKEVQKLR